MADIGQRAALHADGMYLCNVVSNGAKCRHGAEGNTFEVTSLGYDFIDHLSEEITAKKLVSFVTDADWRQHLSASSVKPLIEALTNAVASAKASRGQGPRARHAAGTKLMNDTKGQLKELKSLLPAGDLQYQMMERRWLFAVFS